MLSCLLPLLALFLCDLGLVGWVNVHSWGHQVEIVTGFLDLGLGGHLIVHATKLTLESGQFVGLLHFELLSAALLLESSLFSKLGLLSSSAGFLLFLGSFLFCFFGSFLFCFSGSFLFCFFGGFFGGLLGETLLLEALLLKSISFLLSESFLLETLLF